MSPSPLPPGSMIGILGGGQLGRMLCLAAARLGLRTHTYGACSEDPAGQVSTRHTHAPYDDSEALMSFGASVDALTYEWESIPIGTVEAALSGMTSPRLAPNLHSLKTAQDRWLEKSFLRDAGLKTADFARVDSRADLDTALAAMGGQGVLKTRRDGYDGKGQAMIRSAADVHAAWERLHGVPLILESLITFKREVSIVAARGADGTVAAYPLTENMHRHHILHTSLAPAFGDDGRAADIARTILNTLDYVGVMGVEFFDTDNGLLVNEIAPRVHNSGHWTMDAGCTDQFEQHIRALAGWPLGDPKPAYTVEMTNLIGDIDWAKIAADPAARLHLYGKREARQGRKMGHVNRRIG